VTSERNPNARAMRCFAAALARAGVTDVCISPGSRSTATALALIQTDGVRAWVITDERAAGFFALGLAGETRRPVALLCTSGTAAANYLPAVVEASLSQVPLVVLTADRPPELRDCYAAQTIDQVRLFGSHVRWSVDAPAPAGGLALDGYFRTIAHRAVAAALAGPRGPVHVNLPMREPLLDVADERTRLGADGTAAAEIAADATPEVRVHAASGLPSAATVRELAPELAHHARGVIVCGPGAARDGDAAAILRLADRLGWPVLADPLSGLRFGAHEHAPVVDAYDLLLQGDALGAGWRPDAVLQLGTPVVSASLQRWLAAAQSRPYVVVAPPGIWPDPLQRATDVVRADAGALAAALVAALPPARAASSRWLRAWREVTAAARTALDRLLACEEGLFEATVLAELVARLPAGSALHVGNSLPVRALDTFVGGTAAAAISCHGNRGANGIDGVVATALGAAAGRDRPTALVVGDLSFLHDLGALQIAARHCLPLLVVVVNNDGGGIFSFLPQAALGETFEALFGTPHGLTLAGAVTMCGGRYAGARTRAELAVAIDEWLARPAFAVIEVPSDRAAIHALHGRLIAAACVGVRDASPHAGAP
jgi:2-succinyl-5-enolpyruvyl-6-hydroxy-3-cyclohexene-1-carboxylate synthase